MPHKRIKATHQGWLRRTLARRDEEHSSNRLAYQAQLLTRYVDQAATVLDVGCGNGLLASHLQHLTGCRVIGADIADTRTRQVEFVLFNGRSLPFPNASMDYVTLSFVLHHSIEPVALCHEILRVTRRGIFVFEDIPDGAAQRAVLAAHIVFFSWLYRLTWPASVPWKYPYLDALDLLQSSSRYDVADLRAPFFRRTYPISRRFYAFLLQGEPINDETIGPTVAE